MKHVIAVLALSSLSFAASAQLAPNVPVDQPFSMNAAQQEAMEKAIAPHLQQARETWPQARDRYLAGLPPRETFFVTTKLRDSAGRQEQVFVRVTGIAGGEISGVIANELNLVQGFRSGQRYSFSESQMLDWLIAKPDGSEEGNFVGKFLDTWQHSAAAQASADRAPEVPAGLLPAIDQAQRRGRALADAIGSARVANRAARKLAQTQGAELCDFDYRQVTVADGETQLDYLIATTRRNTDMLVGRHFRLTDNGAEPSTKACLNLGTPRPPKGQSLAFMTVTHLLSPAPNEFHVYLTLTQPTPLVVLTEAGTWLVEKGQVSLETLR